MHEVPVKSGFFTRPLEGAARETALAVCRETLESGEFGQDHFYTFVVQMRGLLGEVARGISYPLVDGRKQAQFFRDPSRSGVLGSIRIISDFGALPNGPFSEFFFDACTEPYVEESVCYRNLSGHVGPDPVYPRHSVGYNIPPNCSQFEAVSYVTGATLLLPRREEHPGYVTSLYPKNQFISEVAVQDTCQRLFAAYENR